MNLFKNFIIICKFIFTPQKKFYDLFRNAIKFSQLLKKIMDDFPAASIEEAFGNLGSLDPAVQTLANRYIIEWTNSPNFLSSCLGIIQNSCNLPIRHAASITLAGTIIDQWNSIRSLELHFAIRMYFLQQVLNNPSLPLILKGPFIRIVVIIALYDFPQKWDSFLVDLLFIPPSSPAFLNAMAIIGQFVEEIETCTYLTSDRLLQLEFLLLSFHDLLLPLIHNLINEMSTAPIGLKIMNGIFKWGNISDVLTPSIFNTLLTKCLNNDLTYIDALKCLSFALFDRNDVAPIFEKIAPPLITTLASLQNYESHKIDFIIKFLKKYICLIELYLFAPVIPDSPQKIIELKATIFKTKQGTTSLDLTDIQTKSIPEVRHLYEITLMQQPDELYLDDFWQMWRDLSRRLFMATRGEKDHSASLLLIQPLLPIIFMKLTEYLPSCMEAGRMSNVDAQIFFEYFIRSFPQETMAFISSANLTPALVYLVGLLKQNEITNQYVNLFASRLLEANVPDDFFNAMLFTFSKMANILLPVYFAKLMDICSQSLASNEESIQINAA
ncbi:hypothetical protein TRFO_22832 [Tritrichomonas foetus]|uniref:Importin N-terminal domain-containing protein n=1 Tax=Tritrichomonas foetus TaxID=1144522 RepID=A0A1J4KCB7_9EUKA|nr:hypothetical protein TRFO_22832 [Tritrichomonas foetus]|eukprot:OHT08576.1 hypothetical protein TRFO_22832 [Tritrichomonas foetus]